MQHDFSNIYRPTTAQRSTHSGELTVRSATEIIGMGGKTILVHTRAHAFLKPGIHQTFLPNVCKCRARSRTFALRFPGCMRQINEGKQEFANVPTEVAENCFCREIDGASVHRLSPARNSGILTV